LSHLEIFPGATFSEVIKFGKKTISLPRKADGTRSTAEDAAALTLEQVKKIIENEFPDAFAKKTKARAKRRTPARKSV